jgi:hypothetical protein
MNCQETAECLSSDRQTIEKMIANDMDEDFGYAA